MKRKRHTPEQIVRKLREGDRLLNEGKDLTEVLRHLEDFGSLPEAEVVVEAWRTEYNTYRPHSALDGLTPAEKRVEWITEHQPALS